MKMIDPHIHIDTRTCEDLGLMSMAGIAAVVTQVYYPHIHVTITSNTIFDYYDRIINFEPPRTRAELIETYIGLGVSMVSVPTDWQKVLEELPKYLKNERVVCIGEIGLEPASKTAELAMQEDLLKAQLKAAKDNNLPAVFHTPFTEKEKWIEKYGYLIEDAKVDKNKVLIDHADGSVVKLIWDIGCHAGITVQPWRKVTPLQAAKIVEAGENLDRLMLDSDASVLPSDPLSVPKAAFEMRKLGVQDSNIQKVVLENPTRFYNLPSELIK